MEIGEASSSCNNNSNNNLFHPTNRLIGSLTFLKDIQLKKSLEIISLLKVGRGIKFE